MHACVGERNGNPFQYSCLENPRDRGAWWAAIYGVTQSWTRLKRFSSSSSSQNLKISSRDAFALKWLLGRIVTETIGLQNLKYLLTNPLHKRCFQGGSDQSLYFLLSVSRWQKRALNWGMWSDHNPIEGIQLTFPIKSSPKSPTVQNFLLYEFNKTQN